MENEQISLPALESKKAQQKKFQVYFQRFFMRDKKFRGRGEKMCHLNLNKICFIGINFGVLSQKN